MTFDFIENKYDSLFGFKFVEYIREQLPGLCAFNTAQRGCFALGCINAKFGEKTCDVKVKDARREP